MLTPQFLFNDNWAWGGETSYITCAVDYLILIGQKEFIDSDYLKEMNKLKQ